MPSELIYTTPDNVFEFFLNPDDGLSSYLVKVKKKDLFYIQDRTLGDLTNPEIPTSTAMRNLEAMCDGRIKSILSENKISPEQLHIALLQLRVFEQEQELHRDYGEFDLEEITQ